ncbi:5-formyltetrahydrofolate cyclo-ligase [Sedimentitalea nanhaiensis]|uniref:5-formyltetrahydrofolate cyclo-ligase n=1 Tax=Sedimentitalea nanhaiensis TaxID=999627 RepID=A0A1I7CII1_9RHOB|nr:5-formyltetrahydrofolate cyclo-ligase [Sedimentitalea nanhaiensis]SFT99241.1 5-formyltetrahydrofolate cyclo-ligase [Sedimentitalea nanhaiensis]
MSDTDRPGGYASSPCMAAEIAPDYFDPLATDRQQAQDVALWRKAQRGALLEARPGAAQRLPIAQALAKHLDALLAERFGDLKGQVVSGYWPIKSEADLRPWMLRLMRGGATMALPVVAARAAPLVFRPWTIDMPMRRGHWNILEPDTDDTVIPTIALAPLVGWDGKGYRLGYGGGYFDRTLAVLQPPAFAIGVGFQGARLRTIYPQPHDIRLDAIVTEAGMQWSAMS